MTMVKITPTDNGPYLIEGPARVVDADGNDYDLPTRPRSPFAAAAAPERNRSATEPTKR